MRRSAVYEIYALIEQSQIACFIFVWKTLAARADVKDGMYTPRLCSGETCFGPMKSGKKVVSVGKGRRGHEIRLRMLVYAEWKIDHAVMSAMDD
jgi:hypothetical protein